MVDRILLAPYFITLKIRHFLYDHDIFKSTTADVPTICLGNITAGGTGKTPHTELILRMITQVKDTDEDADKNKGKDDIEPAVLSRGYKRKSKGFQQVTCGTDSDLFGDEPLQIKNKFPDITVAVDTDRVEGCRFLSKPALLKTLSAGKKCIYPDFPSANAIILDDAFQHRALKPSLSILLIDYNRPVWTDSLIPFGKLRDLKERALDADVVIVSKCPAYLDDMERIKWYRHLYVENFDNISMCGTNTKGKCQTILFTTISYDTPEPVFQEGDTRYIYSKSAVTFTGIANDLPFKTYIGDTYKIKSHFRFGDHHKFSKSDISAIENAAQANPTSIVLTTEKDSQRLIGMKDISNTLKHRLFHVPIRADFLSREECEAFRKLLWSIIQNRS